MKLTRYIPGDQIKKDKMGRPCGMEGGRGTYRALVRRVKGKRSLGRPKSRWDNIKQILKKPMEQHGLT